jgi:hypothetical protein
MSEEKILCTAVLTFIAVCSLACGFLALMH